MANIPEKNIPETEYVEVTFTMNSTSPLISLISDISQNIVEVGEKRKYPKNYSYNFKAAPRLIYPSSIYF